MLRNNFVTQNKNKNRITRVRGVWFIEKYQIILYIYFLWWVFGIIFIFGLGVDKLKDWNNFQFFMFQLISFLPLSIIGLAWIILLVFLFFKPKLINNKKIAISLFSLYGISSLFFYVMDFYLLTIIIMTKDYILISSFVFFFALYALVNITFFIQLSFYRFKKIQIDLEKTPNYSFKVVDINYFVEPNTKIKLHSSRFDYWQKNEIVSQELKIKFLGSKRGIYFFEYDNKQYPIFTYSIFYFLLNKFDKDTINQAITNVIINSK